MNTKFKLLAEAITTRYEQGGLVQGDFVKFKNNVLQDPKVKSRPDAYKEMLIQMGAEGERIRISAIKPVRAARGDGATDEYLADVGCESAPGMFKQVVTVPLNTLDLVQQYDEWPDIPEGWKSPGPKGGGELGAEPAMTSAQDSHRQLKTESRDAESGLSLEDRNNELCNEIGEEYGLDVHEMAKLRGAFADVPRLSRRMVHRRAQMLSDTRTKRVNPETMRYEESVIVEMKSIGDIKANVIYDWDLKDFPRAKFLPGDAVRLKDLHYAKHETQNAEQRVGEVGTIVAVTVGGTGKMSRDKLPGSKHHRRDGYQSRTRSAPAHTGRHQARYYIEFEDGEVIGTFSQYIELLERRSSFNVDADVRQESNGSRKSSISETYQGDGSRNEGRDRLSDKPELPEVALPAPKVRRQRPIEEATQPGRPVQQRSHSDLTAEYYGFA